MSEAAHHPPQASASVQRQVVIAACFGTFLEWYDFLTFATLATHFGTLFYPSDNPVAGLLASLATFGAGMVVRPLGAAFFGSLGDRIGRRTVFLITILVMGGATFLVGLLPTYATAGILAPILLVTLRLCQGMAVGGEIGGAAVYLTEHAPAGRRGLYTSVLQLMGPLGILASNAQIIALQSWLTPAQFASWGWRVPFLLSLLLLVVSLRSRLQLHESPVFTALRARQTLLAAPLRECFRDRRTLGHMGLLFFCISAGGSLLFFSSQVYSGIFLRTVLGLSPATAGSLTLLSTLALFPLTLAAGAFSDRVGRRPVLLAGLLLGTATLLPVFQGLLHFAAPGHVNGSVTALLLLIPVVALACITGPQTAVLAELFPARTRYSAVALPHNLAAGWIGGLSPFMVTLLGDWSGAPLAGLWYPFALLALACVVGLRFLPETKDVALDV
jgi:MFS family permease